METLMDDDLLREKQTWCSLISKESVLELERPGFGFLFGSGLR